MSVWVGTGSVRISADKEKDANAVRENADREKKNKKQNLRSRYWIFKREETA